MNGPTTLAKRLRFGSSARYWERRYAAGGDSGAGSYGEVATFKAEVLNDFVDRHQVDRVVELGCGDGHQLSLARYPSYVGLDVSETAVQTCVNRFDGDDTKSFLWYRPDAFVNHGALTGDLALSLDVLFHLVEDDVFERYLHQLFSCSARFVGIFSTDEDRDMKAAHLRHRKFSEWIDSHLFGWEEVERVENPHKGADSVADFHFYRELTCGGGEMACGGRGSRHLHDYGLQAASKRCCRVKVTSMAVRNLR